MNLQMRLGRCALQRKAGSSGFNGSAYDASEILIAEPLMQVDTAERRRRGIAERIVRDVGLEVARDFGARRGELQIPFERIERALDLDVAHEISDRKSTRLYSSHLGI